MSIFKKIGSALTGNLLQDISGVVDKFVTTREEKEKLKQEMASIIFNHEQAIQSELTKRHQSDMSSDSWLSKNIRPTVLIFLLALYSFFSLADGNLSPTFDINQSYVQLLGNWGMLVMSFYFGSRGIEKIVDIAGKYRNRKENG
jgi:hypothetical protein